MNTSLEDKEPHTPRIISFNFGPGSKAHFDLNKNANGSPTEDSPTTNGTSKSFLNNSSSSYSSKQNSSDVVDSSYNSVFNSTTSTVINTASSTEHRVSSLFKKDGSPARITK